MAALTAARSTIRRGNAPMPVYYREVPVKDGVIIYPGALVVLDGGYAAPARTATGLIPLGVACGRNAADNRVTVVGHANGFVTVDVDPGVFGFDMGTAGDALDQTDIGQVVYASDEHTVNETDGGATRSAVGTLVEVDGTQAFVEVHLPQLGSVAAEGDGDPGPVQQLTGAGAANLTARTTRLTTSGIGQVVTLADSTSDGQRKSIVLGVLGAPGQSAVLTPTSLQDGTIVTFDTVLDSIELEWSASLAKWFVVGGTATVS